MRSKTSYFNGTLFKKNLSRYWPLWGLASFGGAMFPLAMLLELLHNGFQFWSPLETRQAYYTVLSYGVPVISIVYAILCAMAVWSYLYNARSVGMMHTLPIRREGLFVTNVLSGLTMMAIPYAVTGVLLVLVSLLFGGFEPMGVLVTVLGVMGESLFFFGLATLCAFIVGNVVGEGRAYSLDTLTKATNLVMAGAKLIGANSDVSGPIENGIAPACRALVAPIEMATGKQAYFCGKPNPLMMRTGLRLLGCHSAEAVMIGDRMDTDVISGLESGMSTALVLSGVSTRETVNTYAYRPSIVLDGVGDIPVLARAGAGTAETIIDR